VRLGLFDDEAKGLVGRRVALIDLREKAERDRAGTIPGSVHAPYADLQDNIDDGGLIHELEMTSKMIVFYCAFGERSAMAVHAAPDSPPPGTLRAAWRLGYLPHPSRNARSVAC
jgi:rhodanese-related sulfurtransferase